MTKKIELTVQQALSLYQTNPEYRTTLLAVFTDEELGIKPVWPKSWSDLGHVEGFFVRDFSMIGRGKSGNGIIDADKNIVPTEKHAQSILAFCQLSQLAHKMNDGWEPDWKDSGMKKWFISISCGTSGKKDLVIDYYVNLQRSLIYFKTAEMAEFSIEHHADLWKQYFMID